MLLLVGINRLLNLRIKNHRDRVKFMYATLLVASIAIFIAAALTACERGPKTYDDCMLQASRTANNDSRFRKLAEQCKEQFRNKK